MSITAETAKQQERPSGTYAAEQKRGTVLEPANSKIQQFSRSN